MNIKLNAEGILDGVPPEKLIEVKEEITVGVLDGGMGSGKPSVAISIPLPDGRTVLAQTSLLLFQSAARAFAARYGWVDEVPKFNTDINGERR